jgi:hypothetical protein
MTRILSWVMVIVAAVFAVLGVGYFRSGQIHGRSAGWALILRVQGIRRLVGRRDE